MALLHNGALGRPGCRLSASANRGGCLGGRDLDGLPPRGLDFGGEQETARERPFERVDLLPAPDVQDQRAVFIRGIHVFWVDSQDLQREHGAIVSLENFDGRSASPDR